MMAFEEYVRIWVRDGVSIDDVFRDLRQLKGFIGAEQVQHDRPGADPFDIVVGLRSDTEAELEADLSQLDTFRWKRLHKGQRNPHAQRPS